MSMKRDIYFRCILKKTICSSVCQATVSVPLAIPINKNTEKRIPDYQRFVPRRAGGGGQCGQRFVDYREARGGTGA